MLASASASSITRQLRPTLGGAFANKRRSCDRNREFGNRFGSPQEGILTPRSQDSGRLLRARSRRGRGPRRDSRVWFGIPKRHSSASHRAPHASGVLPPPTSQIMTIGVAVLNIRYASPDGVCSGGACRIRRQVSVPHSLNESRSVHSQN